MSSDRDYDVHATNVSDFLNSNGKKYRIPARNRVYHHGIDDQRQLLNDIWSAADGQETRHYLNQFLLLKDKKKSLSKRMLVLDGASRVVGVTIKMSCVHHLLRAAGRVDMAAFATGYLRDGFDGQPRVVLQDAANDCYQQWVIQCDTNVLLEALANRHKYPYGLHRRLLDNIQDTLNFFTVKLTSHQSLAANETMQTQLRDPRSGLVTFQMFHTFCAQHRPKVNMQLAAQQLQMFSYEGPASTDIVVLSTSDIKVAARLEKSMNRPGHPQTGTDHVRTAICRRYDESDELSAQRQHDVLIKWATMEKLVQSLGSHQDAVWHFIARLAGWHAMVQGSSAMLTTEQDIVKYIEKAFQMEVTMPNGQVYRHTLFDEVFDGPNSPAHGVVCQFFDQWLMPFLKLYACVVVDDDDARRGQLPELFDSMSTSDATRLCRTFSYLAKQHASFGEHGDWMEWVFPAIAPLWKHGHQSISPKSASGKAFVSNLRSFYAHLSKLNLYWIFCTVKADHRRDRMIAAQNITSTILTAADMPRPEAIPSLVLTKGLDRSLAEEIIVLAMTPTQFHKNLGSPAMERRQLLLLRCIELHLEGEGVRIDRIYPDQLEHIYPKKPLAGQWDHWASADKECLHRFGNLLALDYLTNIHARNYGILTKITVYEKCGTRSPLLTRFLDSHRSSREWTAQDVNDRTRDLLGVLLEALQLQTFMPHGNAGEEDVVDELDQMEEEQPDFPEPGPNAVMTLACIAGPSSAQPEDITSPGGTGNQLSSSDNFAKLMMPYALSGGRCCMGTSVTNLGQLQEGWVYTEGTARYIYPLGFRSIRHNQGHYEQEIVDVDGSPGFKVTAQTTYGSCQVVRSTPLAAVKAVHEEQGVPVPKKLLGNRNTTNAHEWFGLHCYSDPAVRMCIELLPNALQLLTSPGLLRFFPAGRPRPQGVYQKPRESSDERTVYWPGWLQRQVDCHEFFEANQQSKSKSPDIPAAEAPKTTRKRPHSYAEEDIVISTLTASELQDQKDRLVRGLMSKGMLDAQTVVDQIVFDKSKRRKDGKGIAWDMRHDTCRKAMRTLPDVERAFGIEA